MSSILNTAFTRFPSSPKIRDSIWPTWWLGVSGQKKNGCWQPPSPWNESTMSPAPCISAYLGYMAGSEHTSLSVFHLLHPSCPAFLRLCKFPAPEAHPSKKLLDTSSHLQIYIVPPQNHLASERQRPPLQSQKPLRPFATCPGLTSRRSLSRFYQGCSA